MYMLPLLLLHACSCIAVHPVVATLAPTPDPYCCSSTRRTADGISDDAFTNPYICPVHPCREAVAHPEVAARPSYRQAQAQALHAVCAAHPPDISRIRPRPKRARDAFGPGMVFVVNTVLAWLLFSIDVRNNMLR